MFLVAATIGVCAFAAWAGKGLSFGWAIAFWIIGFAALIGLQFRAGKNHTLALTLLFVVGAALGLAIAPNGRGVRGGFRRHRRRTGSGRDRALRRRLRRLGVRDATRSRADGALPVLGVAGADRVRDRDDLREHPGRLRDLLDPRPSDLRHLHDVRLPAAAAAEPDDAVYLAASIFVDVLDVFLLILNLSHQPPAGPRSPAPARHGSSVPWPDCARSSSAARDGAARRRRVADGARPLRGAAVPRPRLRARGHAPGGAAGRARGGARRGEDARAGRGDRRGAARRGRGSVLATRADEAARAPSARSRPTPRRTSAPARSGWRAESPRRGAA